MEESEKNELKQAIQLLKTVDDDLETAIKRIGQRAGNDLALVHNARECGLKAREIVEHLLELGKR